MVSFKIIYSTQLGTAKTFAQELCAKLRGLNHEADFDNISAIQPNEIG